MPVLVADQVAIPEPLSTGMGADAGDYSLFRGKARSCFPTEDFQVWIIFFICIVFILNAYPYYPRLIWYSISRGKYSQSQISLQIYETM